MQPQTLDQDAVALAKAIRQTESGGNFKAKGKSGEYGAYQFTEPTWNTYAKKHGVASALQQATPEQQNEVAYRQIKEWKDQGLNPGQIASMWNSGKPDAYLDPTYKGKNKSGVNFDVPAYAKSVATAYHQIKQGGLPTVDPQNPSSIAYTPPKQGFFKDVGQDVSKALTGAGTALSEAGQGKINPLSGLIQGVGAIAGGVGDLTTTALEHTPVVGGLVKGAEDLISKGVTAAAGTGLGQQAVGAMQHFAEKHPEISKNIESGVDIVSAIPILKGVGLAKGAIKKGLVGGVDAVLETVAPKLSSRETAEAIAKRGTSNQGVLRKTVINPDARVQAIADTVKTHVPTFNPSKGILYNIQETQKVVTDMAKTLKEAVIKGGKDRIFSFKEISSRLSKLEKPLLVASDTTLKNAYKRVQTKALEIIKEKGGKVSNLLDARQEFDAFIQKQFPDLYKSERLTPMRQAIKDIRQAITDFTAENLPGELGLRESLLTQHQLIKAIENMSEKAVGEATEIGSNVLTRIGDKHPIIKGALKTGSKALIEGTGIGAVLRMMQ